MHQSTGNPMDDTEYSAYLKGQSNDDILSIRGSLDRVAHPERYRMVMAEIETREKEPITDHLARGERPDADLLKVKRTGWARDALGLMFAIGVTGYYSFNIFGNLFFGKEPYQQGRFMHVGLPCLIAGIAAGLLFSKKWSLIVLWGSLPPMILASLFFQAWLENGKPLFDFLHILVLPAIILSAFLVGWAVTVFVKLKLVDKVRNT